MGTEIASAKIGLDRFSNSHPDSAHREGETSRKFLKASRKKERTGDVTALDAEAERALAPRRPLLLGGKKTTGRCGDHGQKTPLDFSRPLYFLSYGCPGSRLSQKQKRFWTQIRQDQQMALPPFRPPVHRG